MPPRKEKKNAAVFIIDIGQASSKILPNGKTFIEETVRCMKLITEQKIFMDVKDDYGIVLMGTPHSNNSLTKKFKGQYQKISLVRELGLADWEMLRLIETQLKSTQETADWLDAVIVAMDHLHEMDSDVNYTAKQIILFTNFESLSVSTKETYQGLVLKIVEQEIDFVIIGTNLATVENTSASQDLEKNLTREESKSYAAQLLEEVQGQSYSFDEALPQLMHFRREKTRHVPWNSLLEIGPNMKIAVSGYVKVKKADEVRWSEDMITENEGQFEKERTYQRANDPTVNVSRPDVIYGYRYGTSIIPLSKIDEEKMQHDAGDRSFKVLKFTRAESIPQHLYSGNSTLYIFPRKTAGVIDQQAQVALSALVNALEETGSVIIVRRVYNRRSRARIGVLSPKISNRYECLVYHELPFADDVRHFEFPPIFNKKLQPQKEQLDAIDELIDSMDLMTAETDEEGNTYECLKPKAVINPHMIYLYEALAHKALHPKDPLIEPDPAVGAILETPNAVSTRADSALEKIQQLFPLETVDKKRVEQALFNANKRTLTPEESAELADMKRTKLEAEGELDLAAMLGAQVSRIGTATPIQDFNALRPRLSFGEVSGQMQEVIMQLLVDSGGNNQAVIKKCQDCLELLRSEAVKNDPEIYNQWLQQLKDTVIRNNFTVFWENVVADHLGLITKNEASASSVNADEAKNFLEIKMPENVDMNEAADEELLDLL